MTLEIGSTYHVKVIKLLDKAIIVRLTDNSTELIHVSKIANAFVQSPEEYVSLDDEFDAIGVKGLTKPVELSLKHLELKKFNSKLHETECTDPIVKQQRYKASHNSANLTKSAQAKSERKLSLDDMIKTSNKSYEDKFRGKKVKQNNRRSSYHKHKRITNIDE